MSGGDALFAVIPGRRASVEPGIHRATLYEVEWIPGSRCARPGMMSKTTAPPHTAADTLTSYAAYESLTVAMFSSMVATIALVLSNTHVAIQTLSVSNAFAAMVSSTGSHDQQERHGCGQRY
ncbi:hypothetical protein AC629_06670 [Bradyrhizobium sp. NAS80.1]|nr:hypothetical protein AC629_06670 [Bradyrhizobium sp. NAS80.1]